MKLDFPHAQNEGSAGGWGGASDTDARPGRYMITLFCRKSAYYFATSFP